MTGFDPCAAFLLRHPWPNLFEPADALEPELAFRCKGCGAIVHRLDRQKHFNHHRGVVRRQETAAQKRLRSRRIANLSRARSVA